MRYRKEDIIVVCGKGVKRTVFKVTQVLTDEYITKLFE